MRTIHAYCCSLLLVTVAFAQRPVHGTSGLVGTWRLVEFADLDQDGKWQHWFGEHPRDTSFTTQLDMSTYRS